MKDLKEKQQIISFGCQFGRDVLYAVVGVSRRGRVSHPIAYIIISKMFLITKLYNILYTNFF